ncbi:MAG: YvrJ family protein [Bacteroidales bacterium]|jgi:hypothetical protein
MEELAKLLTNYAFPVVVSLYLLTRLEKRMGELEKTIGGLKGTIAELVKSVDHFINEVKK